MNEIWKDIEGLQGFYQVSNLGKVRSVDRHIKYSDKRSHRYEGKILLTKINRGYEYLSVSINSKSMTFKVHRLVAQAFIPNPNNYPQVNHIDENKLNNHAENLEWCTSEYNNQYGTKPEKSKANTPKTDRAISHRHLGKKVVMTDLSGNILKEFYAINEAQRLTGIRKDTISRCCQGKQNTSGGYRWMYG